MADEKVTAVDWEERGRRLLDLLEPVVLTCLYFYSVLSFIWGLVLGLVAVAVVLVARLRHKLRQPLRRVHLDAPEGAASSLFEA